MIVKQTIETRVYYANKEPKLVGIIKTTGDEFENLRSTHILTLSAKKLCSISEYSRHNGDYYRTVDVYPYDEFFVLSTRVVEDGFKKDSYKAYDYEGNVFHKCDELSWDKQFFAHVQNIKNQTEEMNS